MAYDVTAANKQLVRRFYQDVFVPWNPEPVDAAVASEFRSHDWPADASTGPEGFKSFYEGVRSAFPDFHYEVDDLVAEGDRVVVSWRLLGTHRGDFRGIAPTDRSITLEGIAIYRVADGKLRERWVVYDLHGLITQLSTATKQEGPSDNLR